MRVTVTFKIGETIIYRGGNGQFPGVRGQKYVVDRVSDDGLQIGLSAYQDMWNAGYFDADVPTPTVVSYEDAVRARAPAIDSNTPANPKAAYGNSKPSITLIPPTAMVDMAGVFELGAAKYGAYNWRDTKVEKLTYLNAALRHILAYVDGEDIDPESGCTHLAHAAACMMILIDARSRNFVIDNRPTPGTAAEMIRERTKPVTPQ
jgi:hypothetical protein